MPKEYSTPVLYDETAPVKHMFAHEPDLETLVALEAEDPGMWLFDSSLKGIDGMEWLSQAKKEHSRYAALIKNHGVEIHYLETLLNQNKAPLERKLMQALQIAIGKKVIATDDAESFWKEVKSNPAKAAINGMSLKYEIYERLDEAGLAILSPKPNSYFVQDPFATIGDHFVKLKPATWQRRGESELWEIALKPHPQKTYRMQNISEGGDITVFDGKAYVGVGTRTTNYAAQEIYKLKDRLGYISDVVIVYKPDAKSDLGKPHSKEAPYIHIDTLWTPLSNSKDLGNLGLMDQCIVYYNGNGSNNHGELHTFRNFQSNGGRIIIPADDDEQYSIAPNVLVANGAVISADVNVKTNKAMRNAGLVVDTFPGEALLGGSGSGHCMSNAFNYIILPK